jgi:hypothetical protein
MATLFDEIATTVRALEFSADSFRLLGDRQGQSC